MLKLEMDLKDILSYREILKERVANAAPGSRSYNSLLRLMDTVDVVLDTAYFATLTGVAPEIAALTGADFSKEILALAMPGKDLRSLGPDTQVKIDYSKAEDVESEPVKPGAEEPEYVKIIRQLLSKSFTSNIQKAVDTYINENGKDIFPSDAWIAIKELLGYPRPMQMWDGHLAIEYRVNSPIAAYGAAKKHLPMWSEVEIGRICEDAIKRHITNERTPFTEAKRLEELLESEIDTKKIKIWKKQPIARQIFETYFGKEQEEAIISRELGRIVAAMTPSVRVKMEKADRKPYVEMGYPAN